MNHNFVSVPLDEYQALADCIRSDQVPASHISKIIDNDNNFADWYRKKYIKENGK